MFAILPAETTPCPAPSSSVTRTTDIEAEDGVDNHNMSFNEHFEVPQHFKCTAMLERIADVGKFIANYKAEAASSTLSRASTSEIDMETAAVDNALTEKVVQVVLDSSSAQATVIKLG